MITTTVEAPTPAFFRAKHLHDNDNSPRSFEEDLYLHLQNPKGIVLSTYETFLLARPVETSWSVTDLLDPRTYSDAPDCYWVYLFAGSIINLFDRLSVEPVYYLGFERKQRARFVRYERIKRWTTFKDLISIKHSSHRVGS